MIRGAGVAVWRRTDLGVEFLVLHRARFAADFAGNWAWTMPGGACRQTEAFVDCASRELREETGLDADCIATDCGDEASRILEADVRLFHAEVPADAEVALSAEHDAYRWLPLDEARALCRPSYVADQLACVAEVIGKR
jgi:8-oxo-dGTP pyrophosphatase MutT (NUDIX family)